MGLKLTNTVEMISLFEPIGGKVAAFILILGISGAGLSTVFPIILIAPWLIADYTGRSRDIRSPMFRILGFVGILFAFGLQFFDKRPPAMMVFSQTFQAMILPAVAIPIFILINRSDIMKDYNAEKKLNVGIMAVIIFAFITSYFAVIDLF
jgi:Mn2+/Fe2+ NRAMP family transporter